MPVVVVQPYSVDWPRQFDAVREELRGVFACVDVAIEHIGSTSVPELAAKPVIDVLVGAPSLASIEDRITSLAALGYEYVAKYEVELPMRRYFVKSPRLSDRIHVHAVVTGSTIWHKHLAFRDALRTKAALRGEYQELKLQLAVQFADDKAAYTEAKDPFIKAVLNTATNSLIDAFELAP
jgi:GrpB-like predicted nucleotidyltransferase (UPF0157 family)